MGTNPVTDETSDPVLGRTIASKYLIESSVGVGAMGTVYRARQLALDKTIALKVLHREFESNDEFVSRFGVEARAASKLDHPNSTRVLDFGRESDGLLYIAMEYLEGRDLYEAMSHEGPFSAERIASIVSQALAAIAVAHDIGVLHRDLKPENIMLLDSRDDEGRHTDLVKVCDFGIAKVKGVPLTDLMSESAPVSLRSGKIQPQRLTRTGLIMGTPAYMSPEQACGEELDARSDIYSIGVILFELITGRVPFDAPKPEEIADLHVKQEPPNPQDVNPMCNAELARICLKAMRKKPDERYATARDMRADLRNVIQSDLGLGATSGPLPLAGSSQPRVAAETLPALRQSAAKPSPRGARGRAAIAIAAGALAAGVGIALFSHHEPHQGVMSTASASTRVDPSIAATAPPAATAKAEAPAHASNDSKGDVALDVVQHKTTASTGPVANAAHAAPHGRTPNAVNPPPTHAETEAARVPTVTAASVAVAPTPPPAPPAPVAAPPPADPPPVAAPPPTPAPAPAAPAPFDPARARMDVGSITTDRMSTRDVNAVISRGDLRSCYVQSVKAGEPASPGPVTLALDVDEMRVVRGRASGAASSPSLRKCLESRVVNARVPSADTGQATAKISLTFSSQ